MAQYTKIAKLDQLDWPPISQLPGLHIWPLLKKKELTKDPGMEKKSQANGTTKCLVGPRGRVFFRNFSLNVKFL